MIEKNPKKTYKTIMLRNGRSYDEPTYPSNGEASKRAEAKKEEVGEEEEEEEQDKQGEVISKKAQRETREEKLYKLPPPYKPLVTFPQRLVQQETNEKFKRFVELLRELKLNLPLIRAVNRIPSYARLLKDIVSKRKKFENVRPVMTIVNLPLPPKLQDLGSFIIFCEIGKLKIAKALCDLGSSISLMLLSICQRLSLGEVNPTSVSVQLVNRTMVKPYGMVKNVQVKVKGHLVLMDFVLLDMEKDQDTSLILGRPFLATN